MCMVVVLGSSLAARNRNARARFEKQCPGSMSEDDLSSEVRGFLQDGHRIRALKQFRKETGLGLKDAKEILDTTTS